MPLGFLGGCGWKCVQDEVLSPMSLKHQMLPDPARDPDNPTLPFKYNKL